MSQESIVYNTDPDFIDNPPTEEIIRIFRNMEDGRYYGRHSDGTDEPIAEEGTLTVQDNGVIIETSVDTVNFEGATVTLDESGKVTVTITPPTIDGSGTTNFLPIWTDSNTLGTSILEQVSGKIGITADPEQVGGLGSLAKLSIREEDGVSIELIRTINGPDLRNVIAMYSFTNLNSEAKSEIRSYKAHGTMESPTQVSDGEHVLRIGSLPYVNGAYRLNAEISFLMGTGVGVGSYPSTINFNVTNTGSTANTRRMVIDMDGDVMIGTIYPPTAKLHVLGDNNTDSTYSAKFANSDQDALLHIRNSGHVNIGSDTLVASALLNLDSVTGALLVPRMTEAQRDALTAVDGMTIYNTTSGSFNFREGGVWNT